MMLEFLHQTHLSFGPLLATFLLGFTTLLLLLWHSYRKQSYWKEIGIPTAKTVPILGSLIEVTKKPFPVIEEDRYKKFGTIYGHYEGNKPLLSIAEPEIIRQILVKEFPTFNCRRAITFGDKIMDKVLTMVRGEDWKRIRMIVTPTFTTGRIKRMLSIFKECSKTLVQNFKETTIKGEAVEVKRIYGAFTMDVIASSAFSTKIDSHNDPDNPFVQRARKLFTNNVTWRFVLFVIAPGLLKFFKVPFFPGDIMNFFKDVTVQIIEERKRTGQTRNDFLQLLLDTAKELNQDEKLDLNEKDDIAENYGKEENDQILKQSIHIKKTLSQDELIAQCLLFFLAGYDTTASTLSFVSYNLALNLDIQEKLIHEIDYALIENHGKLTYEAIQNMKYLDNVISETLRLYPPFVRLERFADEDYEVKDIDFTIPKGMVITIPVYAMHRDPNLYPDPEKFNPDRFTAEERAKRNQYAYLPFGHGPRNCVGMRFALMEIKVCLAYVLSNFRIKPCPKTKVPLDFHIGPCLLQTKDVTLSFEIRSDAVKILEE